ncbi:killer toxin resistant protein [Mycoemilia scoparia]|uniref:Killer toxin resistant protein n=1 Tax=Mycoemilia scoparia TaxID=417184 RepID=A0A9W8A6N5_9FUNG|nr:killer toxin resistant protein [Mycoemilia scoparia]
MDIIEKEQFVRDQTQLSLLNFSLALHSKSPVIQAQYHYYQNDVNSTMASVLGDGFDSSCSSWVQWKDKQACSVDTLKELIETETFYGSTYIKDPKTLPESLDIDHTFSAKIKTDVAPLVLYTDLQTDVVPGFLDYLNHISSELGFTYTVRFRPPTRKISSVRDTQLSGYGVEMTLKSTEYKVDDDHLDSKKFSVGKQDPLSEFDLFGLQDEPVIKPINSSGIKDMGFQALKKIMESEDKLGTLVGLSQDFPKYAHQLSRLPVDDKYKKAWKLLQETPFSNTLTINGHSIPSSNIDPFRILEILSVESRASMSLQDLGLSASESTKLLMSGKEKAKSGDEESVGERFDTRDIHEGGNVVMWMNDLERDSRYKEWPKDLKILYQPNYFGQLTRIRYNICHLLFAVDFSTPIGVGLVGDMSNNIKNGFPMRTGFVPLIDHIEGKAPTNIMARVFHYLRLNSGLKATVSFFTQLSDHIKGDDTPDSVVATAKAQYKKWIKSNPGKKKEYLDWEDIVSDDKEYSKLYEKAIGFNKRLGLLKAQHPTGVSFSNGMMTPLEGSFKRQIVNLYQEACDLVARLHYRGMITKKTNIYDYILSRPGVLKSRNSLVHPSDTNPAKFVDLSDITAKSWLSDTQYFLSHSYENGPMKSTLHIVTDLESKSGKRLAIAALLAAKRLGTVRVALIHIDSPKNPNDNQDGFSEDEAEYKSDVAVGLYNIASQAQLVDENTAAAYALGYLENDDDDDAASIYESHSQHSSETAREVFSKFKALTSDDSIEDMKDVASAYYLQQLKGIQELGVDISPELHTVVCNGRVLPRISTSDYFDENAFIELVQLEEAKIANGIDSKILTGLGEKRDAMTNRQYSDLIMKASSVVSFCSISHQSEDILKSQPDEPRLDLGHALSKHSELHFTIGDPLSSNARVQAIFDPLSKDAQKWSSILKAISELSGVSVEVWLNPLPKYTELPLNRFYRYSISTQPVFDITSGTHYTPAVQFSKLPKEPLYTLGMETPSSWLVAPISSVHDLDNIRLGKLTGQKPAIHAMYQLKHLLVEGHCIDPTDFRPPRGLQIQLGTQSEPNQTDTIVMANYGYLQLQANPGIWTFSIRPGSSLDIYELHSINRGEFDYGSIRTQKDISITKHPKKIALTSFSGTTAYIFVKKRPGKEMASLLSDETASDDKKDHQDDKKSSLSGWWNKVKGAVGSGDSQKSVVSKKKLNIFAVASGHLYERLMSIMILSVLNNTESQVKFWLIENFMSPSFKEFIPQMAKQYNFEVELVTYKWPHWLHSETEKQRTIWGYKILFLDVLFPLDLDRVIFVDADQIVRADLQELADMDLKGAPYGYVPFCDDREEIDGFRFWKVGYWKNHLKGKPYHISALYVVDLQRFRMMAAGDIIRGQYQALSQDSNSLANLDQDLPNNIQHSVPIYSLPQEWLWCETWCADEGLAKAKTIDLCNNPMTKEPKLDRARRLLPEWEKYDQEIAQFTRELYNNDGNIDSDSSTSSSGNDNKKPNEEALPPPPKDLKDQAPRDEL